MTNNLRENHVVKIGPEDWDGGGAADLLVLLLETLGHILLRAHRCLGSSSFARQ